MIPLADCATWSRFAREIAPHLNADIYRFVSSGAWFVNVGDRPLPRAADSR